MPAQTHFQPWGRGCTALPHPALLRSGAAAATPTPALVIRANPSEFHPMAAAAATSGSWSGLLVAVWFFQGTAGVFHPLLI